jgi:hypothetical protein
MGHAARREMGLQGRDHVMKNYNFIDFKSRWIDLIDGVIENGSHETRTGYNGIRFKEVA